MRQMMERPEEFVIIEEDTTIQLVQIDNIPDWDLKGRIVHEIVMERLIDPSTFGFYPPPSKQEQNSRLLDETKRRLNAELRRRMI
jgi:Tfp pilus assembly protein PilO